MTNTKNEPTRKQFNEQVAKHELTVVRQDGLYRHLHCAKPNTTDAYFDIITWPNYLAFVGDMGDFVFSRTEDMFMFFRTDRGNINPRYWAEKVKAKSCFGGGVEKFSVERFRETILSDARSALELEDDDELPPDALEELDELLCAEDEWECVSRVRDFSSNRFDFTDWWESDVNRYTYHYLWCCYAIVWAIAKFDEVTNA